MLAIDIESETPFFDVENRMVDSEEILKMCGSLIRLDANAKGRDGIGHVTAAHTSVIDFLRTQPIKIGSNDVIRLSIAKANLRMAETCLIYLRYFVDNDITLSRDNIASYTFAVACALSWDYFYRQVLVSSELVDMARLNGLAMAMFSSPAALSNWVKLSDPDGVTWMIDPNIQEIKFPVEMSQVKPAVYYAAQLGLPEIVKGLIQRGDAVNEVAGPRYGTALAAACAMGRTDVVSLLLDNGADPNLSGYFFCGTPLAAAIQSGELGSVRLLLGRKDTDINGNRHPTAKATENILENMYELSDLERFLEECEDEYEDRKRKSRCMEIGTELIELVRKGDTGDWEDENFKEVYGSDFYDGADFEKQRNRFMHFSDTEGENKQNGAFPDDLDQTQYHRFLVRAKAASKKLMLSTQSMVYIAAMHDSLGILEILLAAGADPNVLGGECGSALTMACHFKSEKAVKMLLTSGARTDVYGGSFGSSLNAACMFCSLGTIQEFIKAGADANYIHPPPDQSLLDFRWIPRYSSPLYFASIMGRADVVKLLLKSGAETDPTAGNTRSALQVASARGDCEIVQILLDAGSDVNGKKNTTATALYFACDNGDRNMVELLLAYGANPSIQQCGTCDYALQKSCRQGDEEIVRLLLENGAKTDLYGGHYDNALQAACVSGNESIVRMLLSHGADASRKGGSYNNSMLAAVRGGSKVIVDVLLDCGISINEKGGSETYPLLGALVFQTDDDQDSIVRHLLVRGADPNLQQEGDSKELKHCPGEYKATALQNAYSVSLTAMLLDFGAQINTVIENHTTALHDAILYKSERVAKLLIDRGADVNLNVGFFGSPIVTACKEGSLEITQWLVQAGADLHMTNLVGHSALIASISSREPQSEAFEYLIGLGTDPLQVDRRGCNSLHYAARAKKITLIKRLLEYRININTVDANGWSPLHWAVASTEDSTEVVRLLLQSGCDNSIRDKQGRMALDLAILFKRAEEIVMLDHSVQAHTKSSEEEGSSLPITTTDRLCDGCNVVSKNHCSMPLTKIDWSAGLSRLHTNKLAPLQRLRGH